MRLPAQISALAAPLRQRIVDAILAYRVRARHPTMRCHPAARWDYGFHDLDAIRIGRDVSIGAFAEIVVHRHTRHSAVEGLLELGDGAVLSASVNVRAAGGAIRIGKHSAIAQMSILVAANHLILPGEPRLRSAWDETRCGVTVGDNVWVGALCVLLPGTVIGDNAVIGAGSVVRGEVPAGELWAGAPARFIRRIEDHDGEAIAAS
jgi:acetyltransferase-like isoleucine patch superfamily enzyme